MTDPIIIGIIAATFLAAGTVKGVIGLGLPTVSLALLAIVFDLPHAMALLLVPSFATNLWQAMVGGNGRPVFKRIWLFLGMASVTVWLGATALTRIDTGWLSALLGVLLVIYATVSLAGLRLVVSVRRETWVGVLAGTANGILTGMTGSFVVPGVLYLQAIGLPRDMLIQAMGMLFTVSTLALGIALQGNGLLTAELGITSAAALIPAILGMVLGQNIRRRLSEQVFRRVFFTAILILGFYITVGALSGLA